MNLINFDKDNLNKWDLEKITFLIETDIPGNPPWLLKILLIV